MSSSTAPSFLPLHIVNPTSRHTHTIIALHGRGSSGPQFASSFFASNTSHFDFRTRFPSMRWVFPSAPVRDQKTLSSTVGEATRPAWFSITSIEDLEIDQDDQMAGLTESVRYIGDLISDELDKLRNEGKSETDLFIFGRSQGSGTAVWTVLSRLCELGVHKIGGLVLTGSWLVFARALQIVAGKSQTHEEVGEQAHLVDDRILDFARSLIATSAGALSLSSHPLCRTPIIIGHSTDDQWININLGRQMRDVLTSLGCQVAFNEYTGAAEEGHWMKEPEEMDDIADFLERQTVEKLAKAEHAGR